ncbi:unnamed protein product [Amoebophrya sp. A25]|nr:unnamed protein product [Amoebophrya sp. A25]|eukprot:GSA25T00005638001.1
MSRGLRAFSLYGFAHSVDALSVVFRNARTPPHPSDVEEAKANATEKMRIPKNFEKYHDGLGEVGAVLYAIGCGRKFEPSQQLTASLSDDSEEDSEAALAKEPEAAEKQVEEFKEQCRKMNLKRFQSCQTYNCATTMTDCEKKCDGKFQKDNAHCQDHANQLKDLYRSSQARSKRKHDCIVAHCPNVGGQVLSAAVRQDFTDDAAKQAWQGTAAKEPCAGDAKCETKCAVTDLFQCVEAAEVEYAHKSMFQFCVDMFHDWQNTEELNWKTGHPAAR